VAPNSQIAFPEVTIVANTSVKSSEDVVQFLKDQHEEIKKLFTETLKSSDKKTREASFTELRKLLAVHETAEELVVHPTARSEIAGGDKIVDARLQEENEAKKALAKIESMDIESDDFVAALTELQSAVVEHAEHEESEEFAKLGRALDKDELRKLASAVEAAEAMAPTHPHPGVESAKANLVAGPFASMLDRARDAIKSALA
jgi:hemerythrin superfamily protein